MIGRWEWLRIGPDRHRVSHRVESKIAYLVLLASYTGVLCPFEVTINLFSGRVNPIYDVGRGREGSLGLTTQQL